MRPMIKRVLRISGWALLQLMLIGVILGLIAAMWTPLVRKWIK